LGVLTCTVKPSNSAACSQVLAMLLPSPTQATVLPLDRAAMLDEGEDVRQDLAGMKLVGQAVDHGHARVPCKALDLVLTVGADHHQVHHAADHPGAVVDRLGAAELAVAGGQVHHAAAQLVHAGLKAHPGAGRSLLEDHGQRAVGQRWCFS
jgi:hypothetical protein